MVPTPDQEPLVAARVAFKSVLSLLYITKAWSEQEKSAWRAMKPRHRLFSLTSRHEYVPDKMPILPLDFGLFTAGASPLIPTLNELKTRVVTLLIAPVAYIGSTKEMRVLCDGLDEASMEYRCPDGWDEFQRWRQDDGLVGVVRNWSGCGGMVAPRAAPSSSFTKTFDGDRFWRVRKLLRRDRRTIKSSPSLMSRTRTRTRTPDSWERSIRKMHVPEGDNSDWIGTLCHFYQGGFKSA
jgi:hypothetical protein